MPWSRRGSVPWGGRAGDVWVRREIVEAVEKPTTGPFRPQRAYYRSTHLLIRFDGKEWHETGKKLPLESNVNLDPSLSIPDVIPEVQVIAPTAIWTRFDNTLHLWDNSDWKPVAELPKSKKGWMYWTGSGTDAALIYNRSDGFRTLENGAWRTVPRLPDDLGGGPLGLTEDGAIVVRGPHFKRLIVGR